MKRYVGFIGILISLVVTVHAAEKHERLYAVHNHCEAVMMDAATEVKCEQCTQAREARRQRRREKLKALMKQVALLAQNVLIIAAQGADALGGIVVAEQAAQLAANLIGLIDEARKFEPSLFVEFYKQTPDEGEPVALSVRNEELCVEGPGVPEGEDVEPDLLCSPELLALALQVKGVPEALALFIAKQSKTIVRKVAALQ
jgi:hypothetical protein